MTAERSVVVQSGELLPTAPDCRRSVFLIAAFASLLLVGAAGLSAQSADRTRVWAALGFGPAAPRVVSRYGFEYDVDAVVLQVVYQKRGHQLALRAADVSGTWADLTSLSETSVTYGRAKAGVLGHATLSSGISWVRACTGFGGVSPPPDDCTSTLGIPLVAEVAFRPFFVPVLGVGLQLFANVNNITIYRGLVVFAQLGWMP